MLSDKKLDKIEKILGKEKLDYVANLDKDGLAASIICAEQAIKNCVEELEANDQYQELKEKLKDMSAGLRDAKKFQKAIIDYALHLLDTGN